MRRPVFIFLFILAAAPLLVSARSYLSPPAPGDSRPRATPAELQQAVEALREQHELAGVSVGIFDEDRVRTFQAGEGIEPDTRFRLGQVGEVFVATTVLSLAADGSLGLDDAVLDRVPEIDLRNTWFRERPVTVRDLLLQQSGLPQPHYRDIVMPANEQPLLAAINRSFRATETMFRPGTRLRPSAMNTAIAAYVAEQAADADLQEILDALVNAPLQASIRLGINVELPHAGAHGRWGSPRDPLPLNLAVSGDWWASAEDLARFGRLLINDGRHAGRQILPKRVVRQLESATNVKPERGHGLLQERPRGILQHVVRGRLPGYRASFGYQPERGGGFVVLVNEGGGVGALLAFERMLAGQLEPTRPAEGRLAGKRPPASLAGWYRRNEIVSPPEALFGQPFDLMRASECADRLCLSGPAAGNLELESSPQPSGQWLRDRRDWMSRWEWREKPGGIHLYNSGTDWLRLPAATALGLPVLLLAMWLASAVAVWQLARMPWLAWAFRRHKEGWLELLPLTLASVAVVAALLVPVLFYSMGLEQLARPGSMAVALLAASIVCPVFAALAIPAYGIAWYRRHLHAPLISGMVLAIATGWSILLGIHGVVAFQAWNY